MLFKGEKNSIVVARFVLNTTMYILKNKLNVPFKYKIQTNVY